MQPPTGLGLPGARATGDTSARVNKPKKRPNKKKPIKHDNNHHHNSPNYLDTDDTSAKPPQLGRAR